MQSNKPNKHENKNKQYRSCVKQLESELTGGYFDTCVVSTTITMMLRSTTSALAHHSTTSPSHSCRLCLLVTLSPVAKWILFLVLSLNQRSFVVLTGFAVEN